jgi:hypothetical protein
LFLINKFKFHEVSIKICEDGADRSNQKAANKVKDKYIKIMALVVEGEVDP